MMPAQAIAWAEEKLAKPSLYLEGSFLGTLG